MRRASLFVLSSVLALCAAAPSEAQQTGTISGVVTEATVGNPVVGARVGVIGTQLGATTNAEGRFTIAGVPAGSHAVQARMIGFGVLERTVAVASGQTATVNFQATRQVVVLGEVIAVGYGTQRRGSVTGAVDQITSQSLENRPMANLTQGLQGVLPNVNIRLLDGRPTQAPRINIRGATSIGQGGNALVLIDGVEGDPSTVNPSDVESITALKDAASAAVYGARGAFGVLLITTKKPPRDGFSITYETKYGQRTPTVPAGYVTDGYTYAKMFNESFFNFEGTFPQNVNKTQTFSQQYLTEFEKRSKDPSMPRVSIGPDGQYVYYASEDWYGLLYKDNTPTAEHSLSVSREHRQGELPGLRPLSRPARPLPLQLRRLPDAEPARHGLGRAVPVAADEQQPHGVEPEVLQPDQHRRGRRDLEEPGGRGTPERADAQRGWDAHLVGRLHRG